MTGHSVVTTVAKVLDVLGYEATKQTGRATGLLTTLGFAVAAALSGIS